MKPTVEDLRRLRIALLTGQIQPYTWFEPRYVDVGYGEKWLNGRADEAAALGF